MHDESRLPIAIPAGRAGNRRPARPSGPQPVDVLHPPGPRPRTGRSRPPGYNVWSLQHRIPQVTALDDPVALEHDLPDPERRAAVFADGLQPYNLMLAQQFPWCGTLRLRGEAAERRRAGRPGRAGRGPARRRRPASSGPTTTSTSTSRRAAILAENRKLAEDFLEIARQRYALATARPSRTCSGPRWSSASSTASSRDTRQAIATARSDLARQLHVRPRGRPPDRCPTCPSTAVPARARAALPAGRRRPPRAARAGWPPSPATRRPSSWPGSGTTPTSPLGLTYMDMEKTNAMTPGDGRRACPTSASSSGFNLPVYHKKSRPGVCEAQDRDGWPTPSSTRPSATRPTGEIKDLFTQATVQQNVLALLRDSILPAGRTDPRADRRATTGRGQRASTT